MEALFALLRACLKGTAPDADLFSGEVPWERLYTLSDEQAVSPLVTDGIEMLLGLLEIVGDALLGKTVDANLVVETCDGLHLFITVEVGSGDPMHELLALLVVGAVQGVDEHVGLLVRCDIATDGLTEDACVAIDVEEVILQLEGQSHLFAKLIEGIGVGGRRVGEDGTHLRGTGEQDAGLQANHLDVLIFADIGTMFEVHVVLLTFANLQGGLGEEGHHRSELVRTALCHALIGKHEHRVAGEDSGIGIPATVDGGMSAPEVGIVHEIVVEQRVVMIGLQRTCRGQDAFRVVLVHVVDEEHEHGTYALASEGEYILNGLVERARLSVVGQLVEIGVDCLQDFC